MDSREQWTEETKLPISPLGSHGGSKLLAFHTILQIPLLSTHPGYASNIIYILQKNIWVKLLLKNSHKLNRTSQDYLIFFQFKFTLK